MAGCGATYESRYWGRDLKIVCVEKANIERSGAVAQGLYAINCYMGMQWGENQPEDHVRYARNDLMGLVREDLGYDIARHVDSTVHKFEEWGLPIMRDPKTGRYQREGKWQIMIHGESYKPIVAEAARKAATEVYNRIMVTHLLMDKTQAQPGRRRRRLQCPDRRFLRLPREGGDRRRRRCVAHLQAARGRRRHGADLVRAVEQRVRLRVADPGRRQDDADGEPHRPHPLQGRLRSGRRLLPASEDVHAERLRRGVRGQVVRPHQGSWSATTSTSIRCRPACATTPCSRRSKAGRGPIRMVTKEAFQDPHKETVGWENFLGMTIGQAVVWASQNIDPKHINPELTTSEPYVMGSHATCSGAWASGPEDYAPCGIPVGLQPHDDGRRAVRRRRHHRRHRAQVLVGILHGRPDRRQGGGQVREGHGEGPASGQRSGISKTSKKADLPAAGELPGRPQRDRRRDRVAELSPADPRSAASREDHGRICRRHQRQLHDQRAAAQPRARVAGHAEGRPEPSRRRRPSPASARVGAAPPAVWPRSP